MPRPLLKMAAAALAVAAVLLAWADQAVPYPSPPPIAPAVQRAVRGAR